MLSPQRLRVTVLLFLTTFAGLAASPDVAQALPTNWWTNRTTVSNVVEFVGSTVPGEALRLEEGFNTGMLEGTVVLPSDDEWRILLSIQTDESVAIPSEYVDVFVNGDFVTRVNNQPALTNYTFAYTIDGSSFDYAFEFYSPSTFYNQHLKVLPGEVVVPEPGTIGLVAAGLAGLVASQRRRGSGRRTRGPESRRDGGG